MSLRTPLPALAPTLATRPRATLTSATRALVTLALATVGLLAATTQTALAQDRLDRVSAAMAHDHLYVDPDLGFVMNAGARTKVAKAVRDTEYALGAPVFTVVIPNASAGDADGHPETFLYKLHDRMRQNGLYVVVDNDGVIADLGFQVPRDIEDVNSLGGEKISDPADPHTPFADLQPRLLTFLESVAKAPTGEPSTPVQDPALPHGLPKPGKPNLVGNFLLGLFILGPLIALPIYGLIKLVILMVRRALAHRSSAITRPAQLHHEAVRELQRLRDALDDQDTGSARGRPFALRAFDAAATLLDDGAPATKAPDPLDLVGVIVLARQGQAVLKEDQAKPAPPCRLNPLHGPATDRTKRLNLPLPNGETWKEECRLCAACFAKPALSRAFHVRTSYGLQPYVMVADFWSTAFSRRTRDLPAAVLEHLGVPD